MSASIRIYLDNELMDNIRSMTANKFATSLIKKFLGFLNRNIGLRTNIEYRIKSVDYDMILEYDIKPYTIEQSKTDINKLTLEKYNTILDYCKNINDSTYNNDILWIIRSLNKLFVSEKKTKKYSVNNMLKIYAIVKNKTIKENVLYINHPTIIQPSYIVTNICGNGTIRQFVDPYIKNYMICADYSKPLSELNYFYNCLHIFEHYATHAWEKMDEKHVLDFNGSTYFNGLCYIYTVVDDEKALKDKLISLLLFNIKSSNVEYVKKSGVLKLETVRTISEAYKLRNITRLGRTDQEAFNGEYPPELFAYWSSLPMNILLITNHKIDINFDKINEYYNKYHIDAKQPNKPIFNYFPLEAHFNHYIVGQHMYKKETNKIIDKIYNNNCDDCFYGLDTKSVVYNNEIEIVEYKKNMNLVKDPDFCLQTQLSPLLFFAKLVDKEKVEEYINKNIFPNEASLFEYVSLRWDNKNNYMNLYDGILNDVIE